MEPSEELLERLRQLILQDAQEQQAELERQWARPLHERVYKGLALKDLRWLESRENNVVIMACDFNESRFREGDMLILHRGNPLEHPYIQCILEDDDEKQLELTVTGGSNDALLLDPEGWIADENNIDLSPFYLQALDQVADSNLGRENILPLLQATRQPMLDYERYEWSYAQALQVGLNESQAEATAMAYACDLFHLIQGPPGTGKTKVLAHLCSQLVMEGQRVLVTSLTHRAINNALNKVFEIDPALPMCKIGQRTRARDLLTRNYENFAESPLSNLGSGYVIGATPFATQTQRLSHIEFDVVVFDEASQVTLPLAIMGMLAGSKYIFIGDDRQLPPVKGNRNSDLSRKSIFGYLTGRGAETMLEVTYRMNAELTAWPSQTFYDGRLQPAASAARRRLKMQPVYSPWDFVLHPDEPAVFLDTALKNNTTRSRIEAGIVCEIIQALLKGRLRPDEIGVVTPYRAQARLIRKLLRQAGIEKEILADLVIDTVERMQGQEREVILISWVTSSRRFAEDLSDFFFQPERLNVAITRPRTKLIVIGSQNVLTAQPADETLAGWVALFRDLVAECTLFSVPRGSPG